MRLAWRFLLAIIGLALLVPVTAVAWLLFYSRGLPDLQSLAKFAPDKPTTVADACLEASAFVAVPFDSIGIRLRQALSVAEGNEDDPGLLISLMDRFEHRTISRSRPGLSYGVARTALCEATGHRTFRVYKLDSLRMSAQLERRFSPRELFTILANRLYFGEGQYGVEAASQHYFRKEPSDLSIAEAALIAELPRAPGHFAPRTHPDLAVQRRNQVIDQMVAAHWITDSEGSASKSLPILISPPESR
jgi:penicillin-binding protein 1A